MMSLVSAHRIVSIHHTGSDDIDKVDEIDTHDGHSGCNLSSGDDSECRYKKGEYDCPRVTYDARSMDIMIGYDHRYWYEDREKNEDELAILLRSFGGIGEGEFQGEESEYDKGDDRETRSETRDTIREIDTIEHQYIPEYRQEYWDIVKCPHSSESLYLEEIFIETENATENI
jgi:hypothetical protein